MTQGTNFSQMAGLGDFNHFNPIAGLQNEINSSVSKALDNKLNPVLDQLKNLAPVMNQAAAQNQAAHQNQQKQGIIQNLDQWVNIVAIANQVIDKDTLGAIYRTYAGEIADYAVRSGNPVTGFMEGAKKIATREMMGFLSTKEGQEWVRLGIDVFFGMKQAN